MERCLFVFSCRFVILKLKDTYFDYVHEDKRLSIRKATAHEENYDSQIPNSNFEFACSSELLVRFF